MKEEVKKRGRKEKIKDFTLVCLILAIILFGPLYLKPAITGYFVVSKEISFNESLNLVINESGNHTWILENKGNLKSIRISGSTTQVSFEFNATDADGISDINKSSAIVNITLLAPSGQSRANTSCTNISEGGNTVWFNCSVVFYYYDNTSANWVINASVRDNSDDTARNASENFTYYELSAMSIVRASINFSQLSLGGSNQAAENPLMLNNTGNDDFDIVNITAYDLIGVEDSNKLFGIGNITINKSNTGGAGTVLANATEINLGGDAVLWHGANGIGNLSLYFWADVPYGITKQVYNTTTAWQIDVYDSP